ncbi:phage portal protein [Nocardioides sp. J54]|uniref:phage portal protein n=1 Tax=Nocardioides sp. J54 TaxID=935866 RepID=UPI00048F6615|nr:phage portal protein [Nocardioides sp. J54]
MGLFDRFRRTETRGSYVRTSGDLLVNEPITWVGWDGGGGAYPIGPGQWTAPAIPATLRATSLIVTPLTAAPFRALAGNGRPTASTPRWITDPMLLRPDERYAAPTHPAVVQLPRGLFWAEWIRSACWWGEGGLLYVEDASGQPVAGSLRNVASHALGTTRDQNNALRWTLGEGSELVVFDRGGYATIGAHRYRLVVLRNPYSPVDLDGRSRGVFAMTPSVFGLADQLTTYQSGQFRSGVPNGYLKVTSPNLDQTKADALKKKWLENHGGDRRSIAVLNATTEFKPINLSPVDTALDQVKRLNIADLAFAFGIDPMTLGAGLNNSATYNNLRDAWANHKDFGLAAWIAAVQDCLTPLMPGAQSIAVSLEGFANPTPKERLETYQLAQTVDPSGGLLNEIRADEGRAPLQLATPDPDPDPIADEDPAPEPDPTDDAPEEES